MVWPRLPFRAFVAAAERRIEHGRAFSDFFWAAGRRLEAEQRRDSRGVHAAIEAMKAAWHRRLRIEGGLA
jgi:hypothetical protein